jgi:hypothetical protein
MHSRAVLLGDYRVSHVLRVIVAHCTRARTVRRLRIRQAFSVQLHLGHLKLVF